MANPVLDKLYSDRENALAICDEITRAADEADRPLTDTDKAVLTRNREMIDVVIDPQIELQESLDETRGRHVRTSSQLVPTGNSGPQSTLERASGDAGEVVYRTFAEYARDQLIIKYDRIASAAAGNNSTPDAVRRSAQERLERVIANTLSSDVAGLIRPQYLDQIAQVIDKSRPIVDAARHVDLTSGTLTYPSVTQRPIAGKQTTEKTEGANQKMTVAFVNVTADTYMGVGDLSWQAINWSTPSALGLWFDLAAEAYSIQTEAAAGTVLTAATAMATPAVVAATGTLADWMAAIVAAAGTVYTASRRRADTVFTDIASGFKIMGLVANVAPVFFPAGNFSLSSGQGNIAGLRLVISPGLGANTVVVADSQALLVAETAGAPVDLQAVQPGIGGMEVGVIGAFVAKLTDAGGARKLTIT